MSAVVRSLRPEAEAVKARRLRVAKTIVLGLACVVGLTLVTAFVFGVYNYTTDRPAKEIFGR